MRLTTFCGFDMQNVINESLYSKPKRALAGIVLNVIIVFFILVLFAEMSFNMRYAGIYVVNVSMTPTIIGAESENVRGGDYVYADKYAKPDYGDIVIVKIQDSPDGKEKNIIKRVLAFEGDTVYIDRGQLYLMKKGEQEFAIVEENYVESERNTPSLPINNFQRHTVEEGCMFLLGDNRNRSSDSRENGDYSKESLIGVVTDWSIHGKEFFTSVYTFFRFTLAGK